MQRITPHLWFDTEARQAAEFYTSLFPDSRILSAATLRDTPSGDAETVSFVLAGYQFMAISAGPVFSFNPSISFMLNFDTTVMTDAEERLRTTWGELSTGGEVLMPLQALPFSDLYGWVQDRYGVTWQLLLSGASGEPRPFIVPELTFMGQASGKAEEATDFYLAVFHGARRGAISRYGTEHGQAAEGAIAFTDFMIEDQWFAAMDSPQEHDFTFNEATSLMVNCQTQQEIDEYWAKLSAVPEAEQCGWLKDRYGVSWQIVPAVLSDMMANGTAEQIDRVTQAFLPMKKFDLGILQRAYDGPA